MDFERIEATAPVHAEALEYWTRIRGDRTMPARADLDPLDIPRMLPDVMLIDVLRDPLDFRYRLVGTGITDRVAAEYAGTRVSELPHQKAPSKVHSMFSAVVEERRPICALIPYEGAHKLTRATEVLVLPLSSDDQDVDILFCVVNFIATPK